MNDRHSRADEPDIVVDPAERAKLEARNALEQFDAVIHLIEEFTGPEHRRFRLRPSTILQLQRLALKGLSAYAGVFRPAGVDIGGSKHKPVEAHLVPARIEEMCDYVDDNWSKPPIHLMAYVLWRTNWIHPFTDGNGRTARAAAYLVLCIRLGYRLPGTKTIPELIAADKDPYYAALESADAGDLTILEKLLAALLAQQLYDVHRVATEGGDDDDDRGRTFH
ncbi:MAG TPA: Fic family protein [Thermoanaerobaculia bacterium]|nr:Fic family protein [Thermoanaerobaculia bacterium]